MILKDYLPDVALQEFVRCYRIVHFDFDKTKSTPVKAYPPKPETVLHFFLNDNFGISNHFGEKIKQSAVTLMGQKTFLTWQHTGHSFLNFQIVFQPCALFRLTGIPATEYAGNYLDASCIFTKSIYDTLDKLQTATNYSQMLTFGDAFVKDLVYRSTRNAHALDAVNILLKSCDENVTVDLLAKRSFLSPKQFERKFSERVGINPKLYATIFRFNKAFNLKNKYPQLSWMNIAVDCGYYDYQHLVKDYKAFTGFAPVAFHQVENSSPEKILGLTEDIYKERV